MRSIVLLLAMTFVTSAAYSKMSLKMRKNAAEENKTFAKSIKQTNEKCGTAIKGKIDWDSFSKSKEKVSGYSVGSGYCDDFLSAVRQLCGDAMGKEAVKAIKSYTCSFGGKGKRTVKLKGGRGIASVDWHSPNNKDFFLKYLENNL